MDAFVIQGGRRLRGRVRVHGSKNACLPLMAAALLADEPVTLRDAPDLSDIQNMKRLLASLGCDVKEHGEAAHGAVTITPTDTAASMAHYDIVRTMRASICVLGPLLGRRGYAKVSMPGGCNIGDRPVDIHIRGMRALGARIHLDEGYIIAEAPGGRGGRLRGTRIFLGGPFGSTVTGTANVMSAATLAEGTTVIECAACEPEVVDLANMLNAMGARIHGAGSPRITIEGVRQLGGTDHQVIADRIVAGTWIMAAAITNGDVLIDNCPGDALTAALDVLEQVGVEIDTVGNGSDPLLRMTSRTSRGQFRGSDAPDSGDPLRQTIRIGSARRLEPAQVTTQPHPGFPTDLQAQLMALLCLADGNSIVTEKIFPDRFLHVAELLRMGANLIRNGPSVLITGVRELTGAPVMASDLRASAGLVLAGLAARGTTTINRVYHLDRGYERLDLDLKQLGAEIERVKDGSV